ncbi:MAG: TolC family protein [Nitrospinae bacterium]|nr:TolC family protein [Nitrospinota bacterium]
MSLKKNGGILSSLAAAAFLTIFSPAARASDVFSTEKLTTPPPNASGDAANPCAGGPAENSALTLQDAVNLALCNNPQTRVAWMNARVQAAQVGGLKSAYLPSLTLNATRTQNSYSPGGNSAANDFNVQLSYLIYDFGTRAGNLENGLQTLYSLNHAQDAAVQTVFLSAVTDYYQLFAAEALVDSSKEAERSALESHNAAHAKFKVGLATVSDELQAKTAWSQAVLTRIQAEGNMRNARGVLANVLGLSPLRKTSFAPPLETLPDDRQESDVGRYVEAALEQRPDLLSAQSAVAAARGSLRAARASGWGTLTVGGELDQGNFAVPPSFSSRQLATANIQLSIPLFTGFNSTYQIRTAEEQEKLRMAQEAQIRTQVELDVWQAYQNLLTSVQSVKSAADLVKSATESERLIFGRYKAGQQNVIDLLAAQSTLAGAKQQYISSVFSWRVNKAALAKAMGQLSPDNPANKADRPDSTPAGAGPGKEKKETVK